MTYNRSATLGPKWTPNGRMVNADDVCSTIDDFSGGSEMSRAIGVDLHRERFVACFRSADGTERLRSYELEQLDEFRDELWGDDLVAVEATTNSRFFVERIADRVGQVQIVNAAKFTVISESTQKTDKRDAQAIALFLSKEMLPTTRLKSRMYADVHSLAQTREKFVKSRTSLMNKINNLLAGEGILIKRKALATKKGLAAALAAPVGVVARAELEVIVEQIRHLNEGVTKLERLVVEQGRQLPGFQSITSIKGIGELSGSILLSIIGDVGDFASHKKLASYFGIVPRVSDSNETIKHGSITRKGTPLGRKTLVLCTWVAIQYSPFLREFYDRLKVGKGSGKAIVATANKLLATIHRTLKHKWVFEDFSHYEIRTA